MEVTNIKIHATYEYVNAQQPDRSISIFIHTVVIGVIAARKSHLGILPTVPSSVVQWPLRVPIVRKAEDKFDTVLLGGRNYIVEPLTAPSLMVARRPSKNLFPCIRQR